MKLIYLRRTGKEQRVRMKIVEDLETVSISLITYLPGENSRVKSCWRISERSYNLTVPGEKQEYISYLDGCEACSKSEYLIAKKEAGKQRKNKLIDNEKSSIIITTRDLLDKINAFQSSPSLFLK